MSSREIGDFVLDAWYLLVDRRVMPPPPPSPCTKKRARRRNCRCFALYGAPQPCVNTAKFHGVKYELSRGLYGSISIVVNQKNLFLHYRAEMKRIESNRLDLRGFYLNQLRPQCDPSLLIDRV